MGAREGEGRGDARLGLCLKIVHVHRRTIRPSGGRVNALHVRIHRDSVV